MSTPAATLTHDEAKKLETYLEALDYECHLILQDLRGAEERRSIGAKADRNRAIAGELARLALVGAPVSLPRPTLVTILDDLDWLLEEWREAINYMDATDAADYHPKISALERFIARLRGR